MLRQIIQKIEDISCACECGRYNYAINRQLTEIHGMLSQLADEYDKASSHFPICNEKSDADNLRECLDNYNHLTTRGRNDD